MQAETRERTRQAKSPLGRAFIFHAEGAVGDLS
jgi:hypothetical protein